MPSKKVKSDSDSDMESKKKTAPKKVSNSKKAMPKKESASKKPAPKKESASKKGSSKKVAPKKAKEAKEAKEAKPAKEAKGAKAVSKKGSSKKVGSKKTSEKGSKKTSKQPMPKGLNKTELIMALAEDSGLDKKEVKKVMESLGNVMDKELSGKPPQVFNMYGYVKVVKDMKPARSAGTRRNPFTGEDQYYEAKPAEPRIRARALGRAKKVLK